MSAEWILKFVQSHPELLAKVLQFLLEHPDTLDKIINTAIKKIEKSDK